MKLIFKLLLSCVICVVASTTALAAPALTISSSGNGVFILQGIDLQSVGGINATIHYDMTIMTNPTVSQGELSSGSLLVSNTNVPGNIAIGMVNANGITGSGVLATVSFTLPGNSPGVIQSLTADVISQTGAKIPSQVQVIIPSGTPQTSEITTASSGGVSSQTASGTPTTTVTTVTSFPTGPAVVETSPVTAQPGGTPVVAPGEPDGIKPQPPVVVAQEPESTVRGTSSVTTAASDVPTPQAPERPLAENMSRTQVTYKSVLEKFRIFIGQKTPQALMGIFTQHTIPGFRQEPAVALTDGTSTLRLFISLKSPGKIAPNFLLKNAKLISLKMENDSNWLIEVLPEKGIYSATLTMLQNDTETEVPLLVAPLFPNGAGIGHNGKLTEADFTIFLSERGMDKTPRFDLNGDGKRDYIDDYIFTANYLRKNSM